MENTKIAIVDFDPVCLFVCLFVCLLVFSFLFLSWSADCRSIMFDGTQYIPRAGLRPSFSRMVNVLKLFDYPLPLISLSGNRAL